MEILLPRQIVSSVERKAMSVWRWIDNEKREARKDMPMKAKKGFSIKTLGERCYLTADTSDVSKVSCLILLNKTGCLLWELLHKPQTEDSLAEDLSQKFGIGKDEVIDDVHNFIVAATNANLIEDV